MDLAGVDRKVDALEDPFPLDLNVQILNLEHLTRLLPLVVLRSL